jgi:hypothetical protein
MSSCITSVQPICEEDLEKARLEINDMVSRTYSDLLDLEGTLETVQYASVRLGTAESKVRTLLSAMDLTEQRKKEFSELGEQIKVLHRWVPAAFIDAAKKAELKLANDFRKACQRHGESGNPE